MFLALLVLLGVFACLLWIACQPAEMPFYLEVQGEEGVERYACWRGENQQCYVFIPTYTDFSQACIVMNTNDTLSLEGEILDKKTDCSQFQANRSYALTYHGAFVEQKLDLTFVNIGQMPVIHIDTESGNMDFVHGKKGNEEKADIRIYSENGVLLSSKALKSIAIRGNSTSAEEKKPYIIKFTEPENVLGMGSANKWVLLANAFDLTNLRNYIALEAARKSGLAYTPDMQWVELYLNGEYAGFYLLTEKIEVNDNRVEIPQQDSYLLSMEDRGRVITQNLPHYETQAGLAIRIRYPEVLSKADQDTLAAVLQQAENAILAENGIDPYSGAAWDECIDVDSWARKYLIEEIFANADAGKWSQYFYISGDEQKIYAGPAWDYDLSMAISWQTAMPNIWYCNRISADGYKIAPWFDALSQKAEFMQRVAELFEKEFLPILEVLIDGGVEQYALTVANSSAVNALRWGKSAVPEGNVEYIQTYLQERLAFLKDVWLEETEYVNMTAFLGDEGYVQLMVPAGATMNMLPEEQEGDLLGWYWSADRTPVTPDQKAVPDAQIYAMRVNKISVQQENRVMKLIPLCVIAVIGVGLVCVAFKRMRKSG